MPEEISLSLKVNDGTAFYSALDKYTKASNDLFTSLGKLSGAVSPLSSTLTGFGTNIGKASTSTDILTAAQVKAALAASDLKQKTSDVDWSGFAEAAARSDAKMEAIAASQGKASSAASTLGGNLGSAGSALSTFGNLAGTAESKTSGFTGAGEKIKGAFGDFGTAIGSAADKIKDFVGDAAGKAMSVFEDLGGAAFDATGKIIGLGLGFVEAGGKMAVGFAKSSVGVAADFESSMLVIQATSDSSAADMQKLTDKAIELGVKFPVSTKDVADGFGELSKAGFNSNEILAAGNGLIKLGTATNLDNATSAEILAGSIRGFGLAASDADKVVDILATTANQSSVDVTDLGQTFKYAAPVAKALGFSIEDVSAASGILGNNMIKGSTAGTGLAAIFTRLTAPPKDAASAIETLGLKVTDASGKIRPLHDILGDLRAKFAGLSQVEQVDLAKKLAGQDAMKSLLTLVNAAPDDWNGMAKAIDNAGGSADKMATIMSSGTKGALDNLGGSVEALQIRLGQQLAPAVNFVSGQFAGFVNGITDFVSTGSMASLNTWFGQLGTTVLPALSGAFTGIISWITTQGPVILATLGGWAKSFIDWIAPMVPGILAEMGKIILGIGGWVLQQIPVIVNQLLAWGKAFIDWISPQIPGMLAELGKVVSGILDWAGKQVGPVTNQLLAWGDAFLKWIGPKIPPMLAELGKLATQALAWMGQQVGPILQQLVKWGQEFIAWVGPKVPGMLAELGKLIAAGLNWISQQVGPLLSQLGKWGMEFVNWVGPQIPGMMGELGKLAGQLLGWILSQVPVILGKLVEWGTSFLAWVGTNVIPALPGVLANILAGIVMFIANAIPPIVSGIADWAKGMLEEIGKLITSLPAKIGDVASAGLKAFAQFGLDVIKWASELPGKILDEFSKLPGQLFDAGKNMISKLIAGITSLHISLPHINVSWSSADFGPISIPIPNFSVNWNAKGGIFDRATILQGVGEAGPEAVLPLAQIVPLFADAMKTVIKDMPGRAAMPMSAMQMSNMYQNSYSSSQTNQYNLGVYTNQSPAVVQQGFNVLQVMAG